MAKQQFNRREFQHAVSVLKKRGYIPSSVDARKAHPFNIRGGKRLDEIVKKHRAEVESYDREHGPAGIKVVDLDVPYHDLEQYLEDAIENSDEIDAMKKRREYFSFRLYGHKSFMVFDNIEQLLETLQHYDSFQATIKDGDSKGMRALYKNLAIVKLPNKRAWEQSPSTTGKRRPVSVHKAGADYWKKQYAKKKRRLARGPKWKKNAYDEQNAARQKAYRESLSPAEKKQYKKAAKKRAAESRKK